jgi:hypothetical protein
MMYFHRVQSPFTSVIHRRDFVALIAVTKQTPTDTVVIFSLTRTAVVKQTI